MSLNKKQKFIKNSLTRHYLRAFKEAPSCTSFKAGFTVEAAVTLPIFTGCMVCILFFFTIMQIQIKIEQALNHTGRELAAYSCIEASYPQAVNSVTELAMAKGLLRRKLGKDEALMNYLQGSTLGISLLKSDLEGDYVQLTASYRIELPLRLFGVHSFPFRQQVKVRKWTGFQTEAQSVDWVYITPSGTVYHTATGCPYLDLSIHAEDADRIPVLRNKNGGKYTSCLRCDGKGSIVYVTDYGNKYHRNISCSGLKRTVYRIKKSETEGRRACSKCGGAA